RLGSSHIDSFRATGDFGASAIDALRNARDLVYESDQSSALAVPAKSGHLWTLTVPTGAGKTLAAMGWALKRREARVQVGLPNPSIIYALPFTSIIDQNAAILRKLWSGPI